MERLTQKNGAGSYYYPECFREDKCGGTGTEKCETCDFGEKICQKLGQYEDTGLTPEQIREMDRLYKEKCEELSRGWIPLDKEHTPKDGERVLACFEQIPLVGIVEYREDEIGGAFYNEDSDEPLKSVGIFVRAWMPPPKPYEEKDCESGTEISGKQMENSKTACGTGTGTSQLR
jgi:hypothetical protein